MDEASAVMRYFAIPPEDEPVFWRDRHSPFLGACGRRAAEDPEWCEARIIDWWGGYNTHKIDYFACPRAVRRYGEDSADLHPENETIQWDDTCDWKCVGCDTVVIHHG